MNKLEEIIKVQLALKIPVTDIHYYDKYIDVFCEKINVGGIPYYSVAEIITYDTSENVINRLKWTDVYLQNKNEIDGLVIALVGTSDVVVSYGTFRYLYVKNKNGDLLCKVICSFDNNKWKVEKAV